MRITRNQMFFEILYSVEKRSTCNRRRVAALIVKDGRIISMGYAGAPSGLPHCIDEGCIIDEKTKGCIRTAHAEANAIAYAAKNGISTDGAIIYCSMSPCLDCAKLIINSGIKEIIFYEEYRDDRGLMLLQDAGVKITRGDGK